MNNIDERDVPCVKIGDQGEEFGIVDDRNKIAVTQLNEKRNRLIYQMFSIMWDFETVHMEAKNILYNTNRSSFYLFSYIRHAPTNFHIARSIMENVKEMMATAESLIKNSKPLLKKATDTKKKLKETYVSEMPAREESGPWRDALFLERQIFKLCHNLVKIWCILNYLYMKCKLHVSEEQKQQQMVEYINFE